MSTKEELLKVAQLKVRSGGYNSFSFRELAAEVGIKSASVHYHFPTKSDLGAAVAHQYTDEFLKALGDPAELYAAGKNPIKVYIHLFRQALVEDKKMCLCGLLGAESDSLPDKVLVETRLFFERNIAWLTQAHTAIATGSKEAAKRKAIQTIAILEGAILISKTLDDNQIFEEAVLDLSS